MLKLIGSDGRKLYSWELEPGEYLVGRTPEFDYYISDRTISRKHARITVSSSGDSVELEDLGSHNGTAVNGARVVEPVKLKIGDTVLFGQVEFRVSGKGEPTATAVGPTTKLAEYEPEKSVFLDIAEALKPLPSKISEKPEVLPTLLEMARMLVLPEPREIMLQKSLQLVSKVIDSERLAILFLQPDSDEVYTGAAHLTSGKDLGQFRLSRTIINEILANPQVILIGDPKHDPRFAEQHSIIMSDMTSAMAVPLLDEDKVHGILYADTSNPIHHYDDESMRLLATFGHLIGSRLQNYQLLEERQEREVLDAELRRASNIQKTLVPQSVPDIAGYTVHAFQEQCRAVGGDLYDLIVLPNGELLFMVADVSGKGMGAALLMSNILASFRILYDQPEFDLCRAVKLVSNQLRKHSASEDFATLFVGLLNPVKNEVRYVNAGHNPPMLIRSDGSMELLDATGIIIGIMDSVEWTEQKTTMDESDFIVVFTDGVTEAECGDEQYGEGCLEDSLHASRHLSAVEIGDRLIEDVLSFIKDTPRCDDITLTIVQRNKSC
ncbi:MAG: SpoIIE family protein phosphatase [candidate division Zixibacteria bacterium]|nr:SpoIIE family protein phosphatase [candidate division Zixibacteria bacterium]